MRYSTCILLCLMFSLGMAPAAFSQTEILPNIPKYFAVGFEQSGRLIPIENHQVILRGDLRGYERQRTAQEIALV